MLIIINMKRDFVYGPIRKGSLVKLVGKDTYGIVVNCTLTSVSEFEKHFKPPDPWVYYVYVSGQQFKLIRESLKLIQRP